MKRVTIENVQARIAQLETSEQIGGRLPIRHEFEMACLRMLSDLIGGVEDDVRNVVGLLENNEWAEHCTKTELGQRLESEITRLVVSVQQVPVPDEMTEHGARMATGFNRYIAAGYTDGWNACRAKIIGNILLADMDRAATRKVQELTTCNTAQQFEALATSAGSGKP